MQTCPGHLGSHLGISALRICAHAWTIVFMMRPRGPMRAARRWRPLQKSTCSTWHCGAGLIHITGNMPLFTLRGTSILKWMPAERLSWYVKFFYEGQWMGGSRVLSPMHCKSYQASGTHGAARNCSSMSWLGYGEAFPASCQKPVGVPVDVR